MDQYKISNKGQLFINEVEREWVNDSTTPLGGYLKNTSSKWVPKAFSGILNIYASWEPKDSTPTSIITRPHKRVGWVEYDIQMEKGWVSYWAQVYYREPEQ
jgi:hypothetical protein